MYLFVKVLAACVQTEWLENGSLSSGSRENNMQTSEWPPKYYESIKKHVGGSFWRHVHSIESILEPFIAFLLWVEGPSFVCQNLQMTKPLWHFPRAVKKKWPLGEEKKKKKKSQHASRCHPVCVHVTLSTKPCVWSERWRDMRASTQPSPGWNCRWRSSLSPVQRGKRCERNHHPLPAVLFWHHTQPRRADFFVTARLKKHLPAWAHCYFRPRLNEWMTLSFHKI